MSICSEKNIDKPSTSRQIYLHIKKADSPMGDVRKLMMDILKQYQETDKLGVSLGVIDKTSSFSDAVSWCSLIGKLDHKKENLDKTSKEHLVQSVDYLDQLVASFDKNVILKIQNYRDKWMRQVMVWDLLLAMLVFAVVTAGLYYSGFGFEGEKVFEAIQYRPVFFTVFILMSLLLLIKAHFLIRQLVIQNIINKNKDKLPPGMSLMKSLARNVRIRHSIFRPYPSGWGLMQRLRLLSITKKIKVLRDDLTRVLAHYSENKAA